MLFLLMALMGRYAVACPVTESEFWYKQYTYKPCKEGDPIIVNEEHPGSKRVSGLYESYMSFAHNIVKYEAESYYFECLEGFGAKQTGNEGDWGYYFGGCLVLGERGESNYKLKMLTSYNEDEIDHPYVDYKINEGQEVEYAGFETECSLPMSEEDSINFGYSDSELPFDANRPPLRAPIGCWYFDDATQEVHQVEFESGVWHTGIKWGDFTMEFECGMHALYNSTLDFPRYTWFNFRQAS